MVIGVAPGPVRSGPTAVPGEPCRPPRGSAVRSRPPVATTIVKAASVAKGNAQRGLRPRGAPRPRRPRPEPRMRPSAEACCSARRDRMLRTIRRRPCWFAALVGSARPAMSRSARSSAAEVRAQRSRGGSMGRSRRKRSWWAPYCSATRAQAGQAARCASSQVASAAGRGSESRSAERWRARSWSDAHVRRPWSPKPITGRRPWSAGRAPVLRSGHQRRRPRRARRQAPGAGSRGRGSAARAPRRG